MEIKLSQTNISGLAAAPDFANGGALFAATEQTILASHDGGLTWQDSLRGLRGETPIPVASVLAVRNGPEALVLGGLLGGVLRSADGGQTWQVLPLPEPAPVITCLVQVRPGQILAGTADDGILVSADGGKTWARWSFGLLDPHVYCLGVFETGADRAPVFAGTETGIFRSHNNGRTWREVDFPLDAAPVLSILVAPAPGDGCALLFAGTETGGLFRSKDQGITWESAGSFPAEISALAECAGVIVAASGDALWSSRDGGDTWKHWTPEQPMEGSWMCLALTPDKDCILAGAAGSGVICRIPLGLV